MKSKADLTLTDVLPPLVADMYSLVPAVSAVLHSIEGDMWRFWVFISNPQYDDALMTELIDIEMMILEQWTAVVIDIRYVPLVLVSSYHDATGSNATALWEREVRS